MKITGRTPLRGVALAVGRALAHHGIRAILTGGACASIHSEGAYLSEDIDFILQGRVLPAELDAAMAAVLPARRIVTSTRARASGWSFRADRSPSGQT